MQEKLKFEKNVVIFSSNNCHISEMQAWSDPCPEGSVQISPAIKISIRSLPTRIGLEHYDINLWNEWKVTISVMQHLIIKEIFTKMLDKIVM